MTATYDIILVMEELTENDLLRQFQQYNIHFKKQDRNIISKGPAFHIGPFDFLYIQHEHAYNLSRDFSHIFKPRTDHTAPWEINLTMLHDINSVVCKIMNALGVTTTVAVIEGPIFARGYEVESRYLISVYHKQNSKLSKISVYRYKKPGRLFLTQHMLEENKTHFESIDGIDCYFFLPLKTLPEGKIDSTISKIPYE